MEPLDGNAVAGPLAEVFGTEMTVFTATCGSCGATGPLAELAVYDVEMGIVIRCRRCTALLVVITQVRGMSCVDLTGLAALDPPETRKSALGILPTWASPLLPCLPLTPGRIVALTSLLQAHYSDSFPEEPGLDGRTIHICISGNACMLGTVRLGKAGDHLGGIMALVSEFPFAYIPNTADGTVSVIDTRSNTVRTTIAVGAAPRGVAAVPGGNVYVTNSGDDTVSVINSATRQVVHTINLGAAKQPLGVVVTPDGSQIWVGNTGNSTVSVIETVNYSVQETYDVYYPPAGLALTPDGSYLYVATGSKVCVIYTLASGVQNQVTLAWPEPEPLAGSQASGLAMTPDGTQVWVADSANGVVWVIDTARNEVAGPPIQVGGFSLSGPWGVAVTPDQGKVFVTNYSLQSYSVISIAPPPAPPTESTAQNYNLSGNDEPSPAAVSVTPDGNFAYITGGQPLQAHGCVWVISTASNEVVGQPVEVGGTTDALPFGQFIAVPELEIVREPIRPGL